MSLAVFIFALISSWPVAYDDDHPPETIAEREERYETIALASDVAAGSSPEKIAFLLTIWKEESKLAYWVHSGEVKGDGGRANCMGSVHPSKYINDWQALSGTSFAATTRCALRTLEAIRYGMVQCTVKTEGQERDELIFEYYARGHCAKPSQKSKDRAILKHEIHERLKHAKANAHLR